MLCVVNMVFCEGTAQLMPTMNNFGRLMIRSLEDQQYTNFGNYDSPVEEQIRVRITDTSESVYFGFSTVEGNSNTERPRIPFRILAPNGDVVYESKSPGLSQEGYITTYQEAVNGPAEIVGIGGYDALLFAPDTIGDFVFEFNVRDQFLDTLDGDTLGEYELNSGIEFKYFDVTVVDSLNNPKSGRLHSQGWQISTSSFTNPFNGVVYPYDPDGVVYEVDFNGMQPYLFVLNFNSQGVLKNESVENNRMSQIQNVFYPEYEVFLSPPDSLIYPVQDKNVSMSTEIIHQSCTQTEYCFRFTSSAPGELIGFIDLNGNGEYDNGIDFNFNFLFTEDSLTTCIAWDGKDLNGNIIKGQRVEVVAGIGYGATHLPLFDVENNQNGIKVKVVRPLENAGTPNLFWDDYNIRNRGTTSDVITELQGCNTLDGPCHTWADRGKNNSNSETINTWWYADVITETQVLDVYPYEDAVLSFNPKDYVNKYDVVCSEDTVDFYLFNQGLHPDTSRYGYQWFFDGDSIYSEDGLSIRHVVDSSYQVVVQSIMKADSACFSYDTLTVAIENPVEIVADIVHESCELNDGSIKVTMISGPSEYQVFWNDSLTGDSLFNKNLSDGEYRMSIVSNGLSGRCNLDTVFVIDSSYAFQLRGLDSDSIPCYANTASARVYLTDSVGPYTYHWDDIPMASDVVTDLAVGDHTLRIYDDLTGCFVDTSFTVKGLSFGYEITSGSEYCGSGNAFIQVNSPLPNMILTINDETFQSGNFYVEGLETDSYHITLTHPLDSTCYGDTVIFVDSINYVLDAYYEYEEQIKDNEVEVGEMVYFTNLTEFAPGSSYWDLEIDSVESQDAEISFTEVGTYHVTLYVTDDKGCSGKYSEDIFVKAWDPCIVQMANAFTPNDDDHNDDIGVLGNPMKFDLKVFNRWGEVIFRSESIDDRWDGSFLSEEAPIGAYPYILKYECLLEDGSVEKGKRVGDISLIR